MRFVDLKTKVRALIWAAGEAENLVAAHDNHFQEAMDYLLRNCKHFQDYNVDVFPFCATFFKCGLTIVPRPSGKITRLFTIANGNYCDPVYYDQTETNTPEKWARNFLFYAQNTTGFDLPLGFQKADASTDLITTRSLFSTKPIPGRARRGVWSIVERNIYVAPWMQSNETLLIEWRGMKTQWSDDDLVSDEIDFQKFIRLFVAYSHLRDFGDTSGAQVQSDLARAKNDMDVALGDIIIDREKRDRVEHTKGYDWRDRTVEELQMSSLPDPVVTPTTIFAHTACFNGSPQPADNAVAALIKSWAPNLVLYSGNQTLGASYDAQFGPNWASYLSPYSGAFGPAGAANTFWPAPGRQDWQNGTNLTPWLTFFGALNNQRYYDFCVGNVHFFVLDNVAEVPNDPDGDDQNSSQAAWLRLQLALSTAKWKVVIGNYDPYSSNSGSGAWPTARWPFKTWGADVYLSGKASHYERFNIAGFPYIVNGLGGMNPFGFDSVQPGSVIQYWANHGAIMGTANATSLTLEFYSTAGQLIDTLTLTK